LGKGPKTDGRGQIADNRGPVFVPLRRDFAAAGRKHRDKVVTKESA
jgi:hypothetical protein